MNKIIRSLPAEQSRIVYKKEGGRIIKGLVVKGSCIKWLYLTYFSDFHCGLALLDNNMTVRYINRIGETVIEDKYIFGDEFSEDRAFVRTPDHLILINKEGTELKKWEGFYIADSFNNGLARLAVGNDTWDYLSAGYIDRGGEWVIPPVGEGSFGDPDMLDDFNSAYSDGLARVLANNLCGYIDKEANIIIPLQYEWGTRFNNKLAAVKTESGIGYIGTDNHFLELPFFELATHFYNKKAFGLYDGFWLMINTNGDIICSLNFNIVNVRIPGFMVVEKEGRFGLMDYDLNEIFPPRFDAILDYNAGILKFRLNNRIGIADRNGNELISDIIAGSENTFSTN